MDIINQGDDIHIHKVANISTPNKKCGIFLNTSKCG